MAIFQSNFDKLFITFFLKFGSLTLFEKFSAHLSIFSRKFYIYLSSIVCLVNKDVCSYVDISLSWMKRFLHSVWQLLLFFSAFCFLPPDFWLLPMNGRFQIRTNCDVRVLGKRNTVQVKLMWSLCFKCYKQW